MNFKAALLSSYFFILVSASSAQIKNGTGSVLWKVQPPDSPHTSYLLGTSHDFGAEWLNAFPVLDTLLIGSSTFICENVLKKDTLVVKQFTYALANEKRTAKEFFGKKFDLVNNYFLKNNNESITVMDTSKTPKATILYAYFMYLNNLFGEKSHLKVSKRLDMVKSMDNILTENAEAHGKEIIGLDNMGNIEAVYTSEKFIAALITGIVQYIDIINSIDNNGTKNTAGLKLYNSMKMYEDGEWYYTFKDNYPSAIDELLEKRNEDWMKQLPFLIKNKNCFIAVGLKHLYYKKGLIRELAKQGFMLTPIDLKN